MNKLDKIDEFIESDYINEYMQIFSYLDFPENKRKKIKLMEITPFWTRYKRIMGYTVPTESQYKRIKKIEELRENTITILKENYPDENKLKESYIKIYQICGYDSIDKIKEMLNM